MLYKIAIIGNETICTGFELAGISEVYPVEDVEEAKRIFQELLARKDIGIIGITSKILKGIGTDQRLERAIELSIIPMVVELPEYGEQEAEDTLKKLIKRAVGIEIEMKGLNGNS